MDFVVGLLKFRGFDTVLVAVDLLTKYAHFIVIHHPYTVKDITIVFIREIVKLHGFSHTMVSNCGQVFTSNFLIELFKAIRVQ